MSELDNYKKQLLEELNKQYNANLVTLRNQLVKQLNDINNMNVSNKNKILLINKLRSNYNKAVAKFTADYNVNKNKILAITQLPSNGNNKNALLVGINYEGTKYELSGCINDTNNIKNLLQSKFNYKNYNILTDNTSKKPTKSNILSELTNLLVNAKQGDKLFSLYSGHGTNTTDLNGDELDGKDEMIVPLDGINANSFISDDTLYKLVNANLKKGVNLFMLFDSCFSGTIMDLKYNYSVKTNNDIVINTNALETIGEVIVISGCKDEQTSADALVTYNGKKTFSGAMTFSFLETINKLGINITIKELLVNMRKILLDNGYDQIPQLSSGKSIKIDKLLITDCI